MIRFASAISLLALISSAPLAAQAARDFQLPPAATPTADTRVQGPVDTDAPIPVRPRAIETARPAPTPTASAVPAIVIPAPAPTQATRAPAATRTPAPTATAASSEQVAPVAQSAPTPATEATTPLPLPSTSVVAPPPATSAPQQAPDEGTLSWLWIALGVAVAAGLAALWARRRRSSVEAAEAIVTPHVPSEMPSEGLAIAVEAVRLDRSVLNATVGYRVTIRNRTAQALSSVAVEADLVSASRERPAEQQLASPDQALTPRHAAERLAPGQSMRFEGQVRLPLSEASAIWQGRVGLLVPLLRVRATAAAVLPVATTLVIGRSEGQASRPQPFRLDEPPRSYAPLAQRVLDAAPARA